MVRGKLTFISGGVRSGKSAFAERQLVTASKRNGGRLVYIASGVKTDIEMKKRIDKHQIHRAEHNWTTFEQPVKLEELLPSIQQGDFVLWDCLTTWLANELYAGWETGTPCIQQPGCMEQKEAELYKTIDALVDKVAELVIVSNEVLDELPSADAETELYSMWLGRIHQRLVVKANTAIEMDYGIADYWKK
ncbi:bifunctional adenosylcobinamide kinase/adenosylcobinamide-phosphate guanylyltransferase [Sporosarcina sp. G11-34]|uniref:bifunctional adenosylcobinamide kinase/adenosylcobinamide-phosphate guanylyltransferase n=1 Tax=Sporosarcina sp. G11-34 TaxID=2849605 RepID=UPI0022A95F5A|nr:bifunctional adenosylcobinamide kinase/adenosylcobinamide-phosphate guanylyltransferase [Sporosarcina sp. G11-34]MCZ2260692.1 bifunctional adenosylcobinamide kinase/adenosylcobinamide-phosphate guanylyltransferase [Sporosarcina sp. G11-34]